MAFSDWCAAAEARLKRCYAIDFVDAGFDVAQLHSAWRDGETPTDFVERIAHKYDLDPLANGYLANP